MRGPSAAAAAAIDSTDSATAFFSYQTTGYTRNDSLTPDAYSLMMGHPATVNMCAIKINSLAEGVNMGYACQQDQFVTSGTVIETGL